MKGESKRIYWIDAAKFIAMFLIVLSHTIAYSEQLRGVYKYVSSFHVVLFFTISGLTFNVKNYNNYKEFFIKKFKSIMVPYFVFAILFLIPLYMFGNGVAQDLERTDIDIGITKSIVGIFYGNGHDNYLRQNSALWFLPCLFIVENIYYFIEKSKVKRKYLWVMLASLIVGVLDYYYLPIRLPWGMDVAFVMLFFFTIGKLFIYYSNQEKNKFLLDKRKIQIVLSIFFIILGGILQSFNDTVAYMHNKYGNYAIFIISALFSTLGYLCLIKNIPKIRGIQYVGERTMSILIFHKLIVVLFQTKIKPVADLLNQNPSFLIELVTALIVVFIAIAISLVADKIISGFCPELLGRKRERNSEK